MATEQVGADPTPETNRHAAQLHTEAARWRTQLGHDARALRHQTYAHVHTRLASRLTTTEPEEDET